MCVINRVENRELDDFLQKYGEMKMIMIHQRVNVKENAGKMFEEINTSAIIFN